MTQHTLPQKREFARNMRRNPTGAEALLWMNLQRQRLGFRFEHQVVIAGFIFDFWCPTARVIVEVDGGVHRERAANDTEKERAADERGIQLVRFGNDEVFRRIDLVLAVISRICNERVLRGFAPQKTLVSSQDKTRSSSRPCEQSSDCSREATNTGDNASHSLCITARETVDARVKNNISTLITSLAISKRMDAQPVRFAKRERSA